MSELMAFLKCVVAGVCPEAPKPEQARRAVDETHRLVEAVEREWAPVKRRIAAEARRRPDLAAAIREAQRNLDAPLDGGGR